MINIEQAKKEFLNYANQFDVKENPIQRKIEHSLRVMEIMKQIAKSLNWNQEEVELATLIGLLHDIGRFEQYTEYKTFKDVQSVDHGKLGIQILFEENKIEKFVNNSKFNEIIKKAIYNHNKYDFEDNLTSEERKFCELIKDCDKIDIVYEACEIFWKDIKEEIENDNISEKVVKSFYHGELIRNEYKKTKLDQVIGIASYIFDINFKESYKFLIEKDYMNKMIERFEYKIEKTKMKEIKQYVDEYMKKKINKG